MAGIILFFYTGEESPLVLNSCPTKRKLIIINCATCLPSHYCEMYGFQNTDFQLTFTCTSSTQLFVMLPTPVHQTMYDAQTKRLSHTLVQLCGCTQIIHSLIMKYLADEQHNCAKKKSSNLANPWRHQVHWTTLWKWSWSLPLFYLHGILKNAFTFLKDSSSGWRIKDHLMFLAILFHFLCAQHVLDINISIIRSLGLFCGYGYHSNPTTPKLQHTLNHEQYDQCGNQQNSPKLLMMDILMSETCRAHKKWNKTASDMKLVFYSSTITMMHSPRNIR